MFGPSIKLIPSYNCSCVTQNYEEETLRCVFIFKHSPIILLISYQALPSPITETVNCFSSIPLIVGTGNEKPPTDFTLMSCFHSHARAKSLSTVFTHRAASPVNGGPWESAHTPLIARCVFERNNRVWLLSIITQPKSSRFAAPRHQKAELRAAWIPPTLNVVICNHLYAERLTRSPDFGRQDPKSRRYPRTTEGRMPGN